MILVINPINRFSNSNRERIDGLEKPNVLNNPISFFLSSTWLVIMIALMEQETNKEMIAKIMRMIETNEIMLPTSFIIAELFKEE